MIRVEFDGNLYQQIISFEVAMGVSAMTRRFSLLVARPQNKELPFKGGQKIAICDNEDVLCSGYSDYAQPRYDKTGHTVSMSGRSFTQDLIDSSLLPIEFTNKLSLKKVIELVIEQLGMDLTVVDKVKDLENFNTEEDKISVRGGQNAFDFIDILARKRQVLLTTDGEKNIVIDRTGTEKNKGVLFTKLSGESNIKEAFATYNVSNRYHKYIFISQKNTNNGMFDFDPSDVASQQGESFDSFLNERKRQFVQMSEKSSSSDQLQTRADWENNIRRSNSIKYTVIVDGIRKSDGGIWDINKLQSIDDDFSDIHREMLIINVIMKQDKIAGTTTELTLVDKNAYDQQIPEEIEEVKNGLFD